MSPANHLDKADLYFTMLGTAIRYVPCRMSCSSLTSFRIAQALNLHRLGPDPDMTTSEGSLSIAREVRKRTWYQLVIQGVSFHEVRSESSADDQTGFTLRSMVRTVSSVRVGGESASDPQRYTHSSSTPLSPRMSEMKPGYRYTCLITCPHLINTSSTSRRVSFVSSLLFVTT